jgi:predicted nucleic acid-binding protein
LDANVFVRYLTRDDEEKAQACLALFERVAEGAEEVLISESVVAEVVYVLSSRRAGYGMSAGDIVQRFVPLLELRNVRLANKGRCVRALGHYAQRPFLGFEDALMLSHMEDEGLTELYSYDNDFDRVDGVTRLEPSGAGSQ